MADDDRELEARIIELVTWVTSRPAMRAPFEAMITAVQRSKTPEARARLEALFPESAVTMRRNLALLVATDGDVEAVYQRLATMENP